MKKIIRDGMVAVLYSPGFGAGWSTWNYNFPQCMYDPDIVELIESYTIDEPYDIESQKAMVEKIIAIAVTKYGENFYEGGAEDLCIEWLKEGTSFRVIEYDGSESIETPNSIFWQTA